METNSKEFDKLNELHSELGLIIFGADKYLSISSEGIYYEYRNSITNSKDAREDIDITVNEDICVLKNLYKTIKIKKLWHENHSCCYLLTLKKGK